MMTWITSVKGRDLLLPGVPRGAHTSHFPNKHNKDLTHAGTSRGRTLPRPPPPPCLLLVVMVVVVVVCAVLPGASCYPVLGREKRDIINDKAQRYMMKYGYLPASDMETGNLRTEEQLRDAIRTMQRFGHIPITGKLDKATRELMKAPRCSLPDVMPGQTDLHQRVRRFVKQGKKWDKLNLTWGVRKYPTKMRDRTGDPKDLSRWEIQREFRLATEVWGRVSRLEFRELEHNPDEADIIIDFNTGYHGDGYPFDGQGRTLAHAFYPGRGIGGDMHFDDDEPWVQHKDSDHTWEKVSLFITAAHELGHALGLYHSDVEGALMSPYLIKFPATFRLPTDDVRGIQELYGVDDNWKEEPRPSTTTTTTTTPRPVVTPRTVTTPRPPKNDKPDTCNTNYDAISVIRREIYIFKGKYFWRVDAQGNLLPNYPAKINRFWAKLPKNLTHIDAVYERIQDGSIVFFIGDKFYVCRGNQELLKVGRLKNLGLPADLKKIDAAFVWGYNGRTYLFADTMYWRFDEMVQHVELDYPRAMDMWQGVPYNIDAAFKHNGTTYFFQGKVFWEFDDFRMKVKPKSPALSSPFWLGCPNTENPYYLEATVTKSTAASAPSVHSTHASTLTLLLCAVLVAVWQVL